MLYILAFILDFSLQIIYNLYLTYVAQCKYFLFSYTLSILSFQTAIVLSLARDVWKRCTSWSDPIG